MSKPSKALIEAIAVTAELTSTQLSATAARVMAADLARYPEHQVLGALVRCRRELDGRLPIAEVLKRLDDGRPGPEEAWAMLPKDEATTAVWTDEMRAAFAVAGGLIHDDAIAARMAFKESYSAAVQRARDEGRAVRWEVSLGHDPSGREAVLLDAVERGRLTAEHAQALLPHYRDSVAPIVERMLKAPNALPAPKEAA